MVGVWMRRIEMQRPTWKYSNPVSPMAWDAEQVADNAEFASWDHIRRERFDQPAAGNDAHGTTATLNVIDAHWKAAQVESG